MSRSISGSMGGGRRGQLREERESREEGVGGGGSRGGVRGSSGAKGSEGGRRRWWRRRRRWRWLRASPLCGDGSGEPAAGGKGDGGAGEGGEGGGCPARLVEQHGGHAATDAAAELGEVRPSTAAECTAGAHGEDDEAEAGGANSGEGTVLGGATAMSDSGVGSEAGAVGVVRGEVGGGGDVKSLDVDEGVLVAARADDDVGGVGDAGVRLHPLGDGGVAASAGTALAMDGGGAEDGVENGDMRGR